MFMGIDPGRDKCGVAILTDPLTGSVGRMEATQLYEIFDSLSAAKGKVQLTATAREKTESNGPLRLNIKLEQK